MVEYTQASEQKHRTLFRRIRQRGAESIVVRGSTCLHRLLRTYAFHSTQPLRCRSPMISTSACPGTQFELISNSEHVHCCKAVQIVITAIENKWILGKQESAG